MLFAIWDTETTGLPFHRNAELRQQPKIIEFAGLITDGENILFEEEFICNPGMQVEQIITDITGLTNEELEKHPPFSHFVPRVKGYFERAQGRIAHNLSFDKGLLGFDLARLKMSLSDVAWDIEGFEEICTVEQCFHKYGKMMKLSDLYNLLVGEYVQKHRALDDVKILFQVCKAIGLFDAYRNGVNV